jgi:catechol 2,3-dioxygenase-like lactoylglutathione lyase family enzyme
MAPQIALNHLGLTVPDIERAIDWYGQVMGFRLIFRRILQVRPDVPEVSQIFGPSFKSAHQAHLVTANGLKCSPTCRDGIPAPPQKNPDSLH